MGLDHALVRLGSRLCLHAFACVTSTPFIERYLKSVSFPAKEVVAMPPIASTIAHGIHEGLGSIGRPDALVVEWTGVPLHRVGFYKRR